MPSTRRSDHTNDWGTLAVSFLLAVLLMLVVALGIGWVHKELSGNIEIVIRRAVSVLEVLCKTGAVQTTVGASVVRPAAPDIEVVDGRLKVEKAASTSGDPKHGLKTALWPMSPGDEWIFDVSPGGAKVTMTVVQTRDAWARLDGFPYGTGWWKSDGSTIWVLEGTAARVLDASVGVGNWSISQARHLPCFNRGAAFELVEDQATVSTPAGTFRQCRIFKSRLSPCSDGGYTALELCPGIGLTRYTERWIGGSRTGALVRATVDGKVYPEP